MTARCPCCGQELATPAASLDPYRIVEFLGISGLPFIMARVLAANFGRDVSTDLLQSVLWPGPEAGPLSARASLKVYACQLRSLLQPHGLTIRGFGKGSRRHGHYRMHRLAA